MACQGEHSVAATAVEVLARLRVSDPLGASEPLSEPLDDALFDQLFPDHVRRLSVVHWSPVSVALRAAALLAPEAGMRVLDVGAGPGKLCCLGAVKHPGTWHGIERDPSLVEVAARTACWLEVEDRAQFQAGDAVDLDWRGFDRIYLYNPFESQRFGGRFARAGGSRFADEVAATEAKLGELPAGARVVTFHGFGGEMPPEFALALLEDLDGGRLALWIKRGGPGRPGAATPRSRG